MFFAIKLSGLKKWSNFWGKINVRARLDANPGRVIGVPRHYHLRQPGKLSFLSYLIGQRIAAQGLMDEHEVQDGSTVVICRVQEG